MAIRVYCDCGRKLAVGDDLAGRTTVCPACGARINVPKRRERKPPRESEMSTRFLEGPAASSSGTSATPRPDPLDAQVTYGSHKPQPPASPKPPRPRRISWWECFFVPTDSWAFLIGFSFVGAIALTAFAAILQRELGLGGATLGPRLVGAFLVTALPAFGLAGAFFSHVVSDPARVRKRRADRHWALLSFEDGTIAFIRCCLCLCCGPIFVVLGAVWYWVQRGDAELLDRIVLWELFGLGAGWLALQILLTSGRPWSGMLPVPVVRAAWKLGWRALVVAAGFGLLVAILAPFWHQAMIATSRGRNWLSFKIWLLLFGIGLSAGGMLLRLLGGWYARISDPIEEPEGPDASPTVLPPIATPEELPQESAFAVSTGRMARSEG